MRDHPGLGGLPGGVDIGRVSKVGVKVWLVGWGEEERRSESLGESSVWERSQVSH